MIASKRYLPPLIRRATGKRRKSGVRVALHVRRGTDGKATPPDIVDGSPVWRFTARARSIDGAWKSRTFNAPDWREAEIEAAKFVDEIARIPEPVVKKRTVNDACDLYLSIKKSKDSTTRTSTILTFAREIDRYIRPTLGKIPLADLTPDHITTWKAECCAVSDKGLPLKNRTRASRLGRLGSVLLAAVRRKWIPISPILPEEHAITVLKVGHDEGQVIGDERNARKFTAEQVARIIRRYDLGDPAARMIVMVTSWCGFRLREVCHLRMQDVIAQPNGAVFFTVASGFPCSCIDCRINGQRKTKSGDSRLTPLAPLAVDAFLEYRAQRIERFGPDGWLFPVWRRWRGAHFRPGDMRSSQAITKGFKKSAERADIPGAIFHDLRSTAKTTLLAQEGVSETAVDYAIGHRLKGQSQNYVKFADDPDLFYKALFPSWAPKLTVTSGVIQTGVRKVG